jgi:hypothetical protein
MFMLFRLLKNLHKKSFSILYFFFHPTAYREIPIATTIRACIYARAEVSCQVSIFAKLVCQLVGS